VLPADVQVATVAGDGSVDEAGDGSVDEAVGTGSRLRAQAATVIVTLGLPPAAAL